MKRVTLLVAICAVMSAAWAEEITEADKKWSVVVEKMIADGETTLSTPSESRAKLAKQIATKQGKETKIEQTSKGYKVTIQSRKMAKG